MRLECSRCACALLALLVMTPVVLAQPEQDPASRTYLGANGMLARGMNELAAQEYRAFLREHPGHARAPHAQYGLATALFRLREHGQAAEQLAGLCELRGFEFAAEAGLLLAQCEIASGKFAEAAAALHVVLKRHGGHELADDAAALLVEAEYRAGRHGEAVAAAADLARSAAESPLRDRAEYFAALAEVKQGEEGAAAQRLRRLARGWPRSPLAQQALLLAGQCAQRAGDVGLARESYQALMGGGEREAEALLGLGLVELSENEFGRAKEVLDRLIDGHPKSPQAVQGLLYRARVQYEQGEPDSARADLARYAASAEADQVQAAYWTAKCHLRAGKASQAARLLSGALKSAAADHELRPMLLYDLAAAQLESGHDEQGIAALERLLEEHQEHPLAAEAGHAVAAALHNQGEYARSSAACAAFLRRFGTHAAAARVELIAAENALLSGDLASAEAAYRAFAAAHPQDESVGLARFRLGCIYLRQEEPAKAEPLLAQAAVLADKEALFRPAVLYLGDIAFQAQRWGDAEGHLARYLAFAEAMGTDEAMLKRGIALQHLGRMEESAEVLRRLLAEHPRSTHRGPAGLELARALLALERGEEAERVLRGLAKAPNGEIAASARMQLAMLATERGDLKQAKEQFLAAAEAGEGRLSAEAQHGLASVLLSSGDLEGAVAALDRLLAEHPQHARLGEARAQRALATARHRPDAAAIGELEAALQGHEAMAPELRDALWFELAACQRKLDRLDEARSTLRGLVQAAATPALRLHAALDLARIELDAESPRLASEILGGVRSLLDEPGIDGGLKEHARYQLAAAEFRQEKFKEAAELLANFLQEHPEGELAASAALLMAECLVRQGRHAQAIEPLRRALEAGLPAADQQAALLRLGECHAAAQEWGASERAFDEFLARFATSEMWFQARFGKGWALENQGKHAEAIGEYGQITTTHQGPTAARAQFQIGECLFAQGRHEEAARELLKVDILYAYPQWSAAALYEAGRCLEAMGQVEKAAALYQQVREKHAESKWASMASRRLAAIERSKTQAR